MANAELYQKQKDLIENADELARLTVRYEVSGQFTELAAADEHTLQTMYHNALMLARTYYMENIELKRMLVEKNDE